MVRAGEVAAKEPLLYGKQRRVTGNVGERLRLLGELAVEERTDAFDRRAVEQLVDREVDPEALTEPAQHLKRDDAVAAEAEEIVRDADGSALLPEHLGPELRHCALELRARRSIRTDPARLRSGQRGPVHLAIGRQRHFIEEDIRGRQHVLWKQLLQILRQRLFRAAELAGDHVGDHSGPGLVFRARGAGDDDGPVDVPVALDRLLDLPELDAESAYLDLVVIASQVLQLAAGEPTHQISGAIEPQATVRPRPIGFLFGRKRVGEKTLGRQVRLPEIAPRQADAADEQFADLPDLDRPHVGIENMDLVVGVERADIRHAALWQRVNDSGAGPDRRLGGPYSS